MKTNRILSIIVLLFCFVNVKAQNVIKGESGNYSFSVRKEIKPPIINISESTISFKDSNGNNAIDANEECSLRFNIQNKGFGDGFGLTAQLSATGSSQGISFAASTKLPVLKINQSQTVEIPIKSDMNTTNGTLVFVLKIDEPNGFGTDNYELQVTTVAFVSPLVEVVDHSITSDATGRLAKKVPFDLQVLVQNTAQSLAEDVAVTIDIPSNVICLTANSYLKLGNMEGGAMQSIIYTLIVSDLYKETEIPFNLKLSEKHGKFARNKSVSLSLNQAMADRKLIVDAKITDKQPAEIQRGTLRSEVDKDIPKSDEKHTNRYALIIGNQDYSNFQTGLSKEVDVDYAINDATVFKDYVNRVFGVPENQIKLMTNATTGHIKTGLAWLSNLAKIENGNAELIFYYSGHGLPEENTQEPYLIPVDVSGENIKSAIKLIDVYSELTAYPSKRVSVFIDACFSGGARNQGLTAMKSIRTKPKQEALEGNLVVYASSSGNESSGVYREEQHGFFTFYLLKKLKETAGDVTYRELAEDIIARVSKETSLISKPQTPNVQFSTQVKDTWADWKVK